LIAFANRKLWQCVLLWFDHRDAKRMKFDFIRFDSMQRQKPSPDDWSDPKGILGNEIGHIHGHLVDLSVVEGLDFTHRANIFLRDEVDTNTLATETS